jgi:transposase
VKQDTLFEVIPTEKFDLLTREELITFAKLEHKFRIKLQGEVQRLHAQNEELKQKTFFIEEQFITIKNKLFGKSSEKSPKRDEADDEAAKPNKPKKTKIQLPSQRYPNAPLIERDVELKTLPNCKCCGTEMADSGMTEDSEFLTVIPAEYIVIRQKRHKYRCGKCHGDLQTAPAPPRIKPGSSYSDEMMVDVALTKYCDLIPIERYSAIAGRAGLKDLPPQSLIESSHYVAEFVRSAYDRLKLEITKEKVLHADETPHKMLEGDKKSNWYLWGFSGLKTSYFEIHDTRSGDVASELLKDSNCEFLVSDVYSGYGKAVKDTNDYREEKKLPKIKNVYCNAHARRKFKDAKDRFPDEAKFFMGQYEKIYKLESDAKEDKPDQIPNYRHQMAVYFEGMKNRAMENMAGYSSKSSIAKAMSYFLKNFKDLTLYLKNPDLPIDNNPQERLLRNPVIGRKTWYGTHSIRGAETAATLFSLVESCKLNKINPREYFKKLIEDLHLGKNPYTPKEFNNLAN